MENKISAQDKESESTSVLKTTFVTKDQTAALMQVLDLEELNRVSGGAREGNDRIDPNICKPGSDLDKCGNAIRCTCS
jgi:hypothetical protein